MEKELLNKFFANQCSSKEIDEVFDWLQKPSGKFQEEILLKRFWNNIRITDNSDEELVRRRLDRIHHTINLNQSVRFADRKKHSDISKKKFIRKLVQIAAAILLIPVLSILIYTRLFQSELYSLLNESQKYEVISPSGSRTQFELSDGTKVWLNQGSKLVYPHHFNGNDRTVQLNGEGYFKVASDKSKPFIVESKGIAVKAVGTAFNVKAYPDDIDFETTLEAGKVVILRNISDSKIEICKMKPGEHFVFHKDANKYTLKTEDPFKYVSWREGKLVFKDDHLDEVAEKLSRWYNVKVILMDTELKSLTYTATFVDETLDQLMEMFEIVSPISYEVSKRHKLPDGTFSQMEILIYKRREGKTK